MTPRWRNPVRAPCESAASQGERQQKQLATQAGAGPPCGGQPLEPRRNPLERPGDPDAKPWGTAWVLFPLEVVLHVQSHGLRFPCKKQTPGRLRPGPSSASASHRLPACPAPGVLGDRGAPLHGKPPNCQSSSGTYAAEALQGDSAERGPRLPPPLLSHLGVLPRDAPRSSRHRAPSRSFHPDRAALFLCWTIKQQQNIVT